MAEQISNWVLVWEVLSVTSTNGRKYQITRSWWNEELSLENDGKKGAWTSSMDDLLKAETIHVICRTGCRGERDILKEVLYVGGGLGIWVVGGSWWRAGSGTVLWCGSIWEDTNTGSSFHYAYQHTVQRTHRHTHTQTVTNVRQKRTRTNYWTMLAFLWVQTKGNKSLLATHDETKSWPRGKINK